MLDSAGRTARMEGAMATNKWTQLFRANRAIRYSLYVTVAIALFAVIGFFVLPPLAKSLLLEHAGKALQRTVAVKQIRINPFAMTLDIDGVSIKEPEGGETFAGFDSLHVNLEFESLFKGGVVLREVRLLNPRLHVARLSDKRYNFSDLVGDSASAQKSDAKGPLFSVNNIQLQGGTIVFEDRPMHEKHEIRDLAVTIPFVSNMAYALETFVEPSFSANVNGAQVHLKGRTKPFAESHESELDLDLSDFRIARYFDYSPIKLPIRIESGAIDSAMKLSFRQEKNKGASLHVSGRASLRDLDLREASGQALAKLKRLDLTLKSADVLGRRFEVDKVALDSPAVNVRINKQGALNWKTLLPKDAAPAKEEAPASGVAWSLGEFSIADGSLVLVDESRPLPLRSDLAALKLSLSKLDSVGNEPAVLSARFKLNRNAEINLDGKLKPFEPAADLDLSLRNLELLPFQALFAEKLNVAVTRGVLTAKGAVQVRKPTKASEGFDGGFSGELTLGNFLAVDKLNSADFLRWKSLYFGKIDVNLNPLSASVGEIALADFFARVIVSPEGKLNLMQLVRDGEAGSGATQASEPAVEGKASVPLAKKAAESASPVPIRIGRITLQGGDVRFTDNFVKPHYSANLKNIAGRVSGLSSVQGTTASLELRGSYDNVAPLNIVAQVNPLSAKPFLDLQAEIRGVEMNRFSSYSGKYAGYAIEKGKLSLFVKYKIENDQLQAENRVFLDQLTFGDRVESPDATKLPVTLAVSLLKNRNGEIDLDLPISGSLSDPQFSVGGVVVKVIVNLLVKAVTAPFALLGSLFGGEELSMIDFDPGRAAITPAAEKRLEGLAKALTERPELKLEITGHVDPESDQEGLKRARIERKLKALKREEMTRKGTASGSLDTIEVSAEEYPVLLERAYRAENFPKPRNMVGLVKTLPVEEMEKLMLTHSSVDADDLRELGERRANAARDWLAAHQLPLERIFLLPGKVGDAEGKAEEDKKGKSGSRVDFSLK